MKSIELQQVTKRFPDGTVALDAVNLSVDSGECLTVVGPSGSGKTTLLRILAGLEASTGGRVWLDGQDVTQQPSANRNVSMIFQGQNLLEHLTVRDNLLLGPRLQRQRREDTLRQVASVAEQFGLRHLLARFPAELSGGEQQRVALARTVVVQSRLLLLDEPLSQLDAVSQVDLSDLLLEMRRRSPITVVLVTHDQAEALASGERLAVMRHGRIEQLGSPRDVYASPATRFVAEFLGNPPCFFVDGEWRGDEFHWAGNRLSLPPRALALLPRGRVTLGLRADDVHCVSLAGQSLDWPLPQRASELQLRVEATIMRVDFHGHELVLTAQIAGEPSGTLYGRLPAHVRAQPGQIAVFGIDGKSLRLVGDQQQLTLLGELGGGDRIP